MITTLILCAIATSIVGGVAGPVFKILRTTYVDERKRLESGGQPVYPESYIHHPEMLEEMKLPQDPKSSRTRKETEMMN